MIEEKPEWITDDLWNKWKKEYENALINFEKVKKDYERIENELKIFNLIFKN